MASEPEEAGEAAPRATDGIGCIDLLGVRVHAVDMEGALDAVRAFVSSGRPHFVVTADSSGLVLAQRDAQFRQIINSADLVTPDSFGILLGARKLGTPLPARVSGVDLAYRICQMAAEEGFSVFLLGAEPGVAEAAARKLQEAIPGLSVAGTYHGYFTPDEEPAVIARVRESGAKALLVAMGIPRQEKWIHAHLADLGVSVAIGVGGTLDVFSGRIKRAPLWMRRHGLEWVYRLARDPSKISKVASLPRFVWLVLKTKTTGSRAS